MAYLTTTIGQAGPIIQVRVGISAVLRALLTSIGLSVPPAVQADLLVDTGAEGTAVDDTIIAALGLQPTGSANMRTPSTGAKPLIIPTFEIELTLPANNPKVFPTLTVCGGHFLTMGYHGLIGRDVLAHCRMDYDGPRDFVTLSF